MLETDRNHPIRVCASASGFSTLMLGMAKGISTAPIASSNAPSCLAFGANSDPMVGATVRCSQAIGLPEPSRPASRRSTDTVWKKLCCISSSRVKVSFTGRPPMARDRIAASLAKSGFDLRPKPPPSRSGCTLTLSSGRLKRFARSIRIASGFCTLHQTSQPSLVTRAVAVGGSIGA